MGEIGSPARLYVDLDDVICQTIELLLSLLDAEFGRKVSVEQVTCFDLGVSFGLSTEDLQRFLDRAHDPEILLQYELCRGAVEGLAALRSMGHEVWIVTGRPTSAAAGTERWLHRAGVPHDRLLFVNKYAGRAYEPGDGVRGTPVSELGDLGFGLAVEDSAEMAARLRDELEVPVLLIDRPWNRTVPEVPGRVERCAGWDEVMVRLPQLIPGPARGRPVTPDRR